MFKKLREYIRQRQAAIALAKARSRPKGGQQPRSGVQTNHVDMAPQAQDELSICIRPVDPSTGECGEWQQVKEDADAGDE